MLRYGRNDRIARVIDVVVISSVVERSNQFRFFDLVSLRSE